MLLSAKRLFILFLLFISSCGFTAAYDSKNNDASQVEFLAKKLGVIFENKYYPIEEKRRYDYLKDKILENYNLDISESKYLVKFKNYSQRVSGIRIDNDGNFQTFKMYISIEYEISKTNDKEVLFSTQIEVNNNYNITDSIYVSEVIERQVARDLNNSLISRINSSLLLAIKSL